MTLIVAGVNSETGRAEVGSGTGGNSVTFNGNTVAVLTGTITVSGKSLTGAGTSGGISLTAGLGLDGASGGQASLQGGTCSGSPGGTGGAVLVRGGTSDGTDNAGGNCTIQAGTSRGSAFSTLSLKTCLSGASGNTSQTALDRVVIPGRRLSVLTAEMISCAVNYTSRCSDGTDHQTEDGWVTISAVNKAGTITASISGKYGNVQSVSGGTLTVTPSYYWHQFSQFCAQER